MTQIVCIFHSFNSFLRAIRRLNFLNGDSRLFVIVSNEFIISYKMIKDIVLNFSTITSIVGNVHTRDNAQRGEQIQGNPLEFNFMQIAYEAFCGTYIVCNNSILPSMTLPGSLNIPKKCPKCYCYDKLFFKLLNILFIVVLIFSFNTVICSVSILVFFHRAKKKQHLTSVTAPCPSNASGSVIEYCTKNSLGNQIFNHTTSSRSSN